MKALDKLRRLHEAATRKFKWKGGPEAEAQRARVLEAIDDFSDEAIACFPALLRVVEAAKAVDNGQCCGCDLIREMRNALADLEKQQ